VSTEMVVDILYSSIQEIGRERIRMDIISDIASSKKYCKDIVTECKNKLADNANDEILGTLCEATLHFMLTVSLLPSERKVNVKGIDLDIVIPSVKSLDKQPEKTLVIQVIKKDSDIAKITQAESMQPNYTNIWIVSAKRLNTKYRNYYLDSTDHPYYIIIENINAFLVDKGVRGLKLLH
jgi:hypothetical protein